MCRGCTGGSTASLRGPAVTRVRCAQQVPRRFGSRCRFRQKPFVPGGFCTVCAPGEASQRHLVTGQQKRSSWPSISVLVSLLLRSQAALGRFSARRKLPACSPGRPRRPEGSAAGRALAEPRGPARTDTSRSQWRAERGHYITAACSHWLLPAPAAAPLPGGFPWLCLGAAPPCGGQGQGQGSGSGVRARVRVRVRVG